MDKIVWRLSRFSTAVLLTALSSVCALSLAEPVGAADSGYRLGPEDKVRVKVYEWRPSRDEIFEWTALNDEFTVSAAGTLSLPLVGEIVAAGVAPAELATRIGGALQSTMALGRRPNASVEVIEFRPFYIVGEVDRPGAFPYRPGLTVLQALSIAGGLRRTTDYGLLRIERDAILARGDADVSRRQVNSLLARRARLEAELNEAEAINFPAVLTAQRDDPSIARILRQEQQIFETQREGFKTQMQALEQLKGHFEKEVGQLNAQMTTEDRQIELVKKELEGVSVLANKGLASAPRQLSLERMVAQIEGERLRVGTSLLRTRQEIAKTDISILELKNKRKNEAAAKLRETQSQFDELARKMETSERLVYEAEITTPQLLSRLVRSRRIEPVYKIVRQKSGAAVELAASEATAVEPGDTIKVDLPAPTDIREQSASATPLPASR
jgi:protein involved in polysaccharide export with SLBB domain